MTGPSGGADGERERRVKELFERVFDASAEDREALLAAADGPDSIRADVVELLRHADGLGEFLETPAAHRLVGTPAAAARLAPGDEVADFTVIRFLAEGGGGAVYEAEQREPRRRVALKTIRAGASSRAALHGFREEAASLARLHHAGIAHVYAAGVRDCDGRAQPWIAMELVEGARSIVRYAREEGLTRDARLRLFLGVCDALHHAHQNGVIHRDVTPGNVLVDAEGRPKVVDFGVACGIEAQDERAADAVGTLAYASPEQLAGDRRRVDLRADVYGLGALLHELLTGAPPHAVDDVSVCEAARIKREVPVAAPGARSAQVPPDLAAIVLRALATDREQRYGSAVALADDVARFLACEPVAAHRGGAWYQLSKFVRRRRATAAAISGIAVSLVAGTAVSAKFAVENAAARDLAERRSYTAEIAAAAAALRVDDAAEARRRLDRAPAALRDWEWRHLASRIDISRETASFAQHELWYGSVSRDGSLMAVSGSDRKAAAGWDNFAILARDDGTWIRTWRFRADAVRSVVGLLREDGSVVEEWPSTEISGVPSSAISPDGSRLAIGLSSGGVLCYDVATRTQWPVLAAHGARVIAVKYSSDGARFATACRDGTARLWSSGDRSLLATFGGHADRVICLAFDASGERLVTGCRDGSIHVFDTRTGAVIRVITGHEASVEGVSVSPDGTRLASVSRDRTVRLWDLAGGALLAAGRSHASNVRDVAFDPSGGSYVSASWDGTLRVWDVRSGAETCILRGHGSAVTAVAFAQCAPRVVSFSRDGTVKRWDPESAGVAACRGLRDQAVALAFDPGGTRVAAAGHDGRLTILDARSGSVAHAIDASTSALRCVAFLDARSLVLLTDGHDLQVWDLPPAGPPVRERRFVDAGVLHGALCLDGGSRAAWVTTAGADAVYDTLARIDLGSGAVTETRRSPVPANSIACDGYGALAVGGLDGTIGVRDARGVWTTVRPGTGPVRSVAFDETGERIVAASSDGIARVLRAADLATLLVLRGHSDVVYQAGFLPGGSRIVTVSRDLTVRLWDASDGECALVLREHGYPVTCVAVSRDGTRIATGAGATEDAESTVKVWEAPPDLR